MLITTSVVSANHCSLCRPMESRATQPVQQSATLEIPPLTGEKNAIIIVTNAQAPLLASVLNASPGIIFSRPALNAHQHDHLVITRTE